MARLGLRIGELQKIKDFNLTNPAVQAKMHERYGDQVPLEEPVISPVPRSLWRLRRNCAEFSILTLTQPGAFAVKIEGAFEDGRLDIKTALSTPFVQVKKREPIRELGPQVER